MNDNNDFSMICTQFDSIIKKPCPKYQNTPKLQSAVIGYVGCKKKKPATTAL